MLRNPTFSLCLCPAVDSRPRNARCQKPTVHGQHFKTSEHSCSFSSSKTKQNKTKFKKPHHVPLQVKFLYHKGARFETTQVASTWCLRRALLQGCEGRRKAARCRPGKRRRRWCAPLQRAPPVPTSDTHTCTDWADYLDYTSQNS